MTMMRAAIATLLLLGLCSSASAYEMDCRWWVKSWDGRWVSRFEITIEAAGQQRWVLPPNTALTPDRTAIIDFAAGLDQMCRDQKGKH